MARCYATETATASKPDITKPHSSTVPARSPRARKEKRQRFILDLGGVPITVLPTDIARLLDNHHIVNYIGIQRDYARFWPKENVLIVFGTPSERDNAIKVLESAKLAGMNLHPRLYIPDPMQFVPKTGQPKDETTDSTNQPSKPPRLRGRKGKEKLLAEGNLSGNGPSAGLPFSESGKSVVLSGLPGKLYCESLQTELLQDFILRDDVTPVVKIQPALRSPLYSRFLVRTTSEAEALRLFQTVNMTYYLQEGWGDRYLIRARIIY